VEESVTEEIAVSAIITDSRRFAWLKAAVQQGFTLELYPARSPEKQFFMRAVVIDAGGHEVAWNGEMFDSVDAVIDDAMVALGGAVHATDPAGECVAALYALRYRLLKDGEQIVNISLQRDEVQVRLLDPRHPDGSRRVYLGETLDEAIDALVEDRRYERPEAAAEYMHLKALADAEAREAGHGAEAPCTGSSRTPKAIGSIGRATPTTTIATRQAATPC
jgi:hypothetical protein